jgi:hypothetical protein
VGVLGGGGRVACVMVHDLCELTQHCALFMDISHTIALTPSPGPNH